MFFTRIARYLPMIFFQKIRAMGLKPGFFAKPKKKFLPFEILKILSAVYLFVSKYYSKSLD
jgi:hypothetical protein